MNRPNLLRCCLASLETQTTDCNLHVLVACNSMEPSVQKLHRAVVLEDNTADLYFTAQQCGALDCYYAAEALVGDGLATGEWIGFPSDDGYHTPNYLANMLASARENNWDFVYCDMLSSSFWLKDGSGPSPTRTDYEYINVSPVKTNNRYTIDKTCMLVKTALFREIGFPGKLNGKPCGADGMLAEELVRRGVRHGKARGGALVVHS